MDADEDEARDIVPDATQSGRHGSPPPVGLRQRLHGKAGTSADQIPRFTRRSSSFMSEAFSDSRRSFQASTDDLLRPRARIEHDDPVESSHWHSLPLGLAIVPAIGGLFFQNGSAFLTDIILLALAALFLNWAVRLPWDWYHSAQAMVIETESPMPGTPIETSESDSTPPIDGSGVDESPKSNNKKSQQQANLFDENARKARHELRVHEALALAACFASPLLGSWLLHAIRSQLSRPSEGLVSDFNITIFLLGAEVRPLMHLIKLIQRRTIFLQRRISAQALKWKDQQQDERTDDLAKRVEDLEAHISDHISQSSNDQTQKVDISQEEVTKASIQAVANLQKSIQPELDALNRAMRRYEKRSTIATIQTEARLQDLESKVNDVVVLAAAAHRNADEQYGRYSRVLLNGVSAIIVVPLNYLLWIATMPNRFFLTTVDVLKRKLGFAQKGKERQTMTKPPAPRQRSKEKRPKSTS